MACGLADRCVVDNGGNFIDTSNNYQNEESETWIGEWMKKRNNRDQMVIATKFTSPWQAHKGWDKHINANFVGSGTKSLRMSVRDSLKKLGTDYIDILYVHWYDHTSSVQELMLSLNDLLREGKVLYLGASDLPAYFVAKCNQYARDHGLRGFVVYQGKWSAADRDFERDILHLVKEDGMALAPWGALGGGLFKTHAKREEMKKNDEQGRIAIMENAKAGPVSDALEKIAAKKNGKPDITSIALAYVMHKAPCVFPIVGGRKIDHLKGNIEALKIDLSTEEIDEIDGAVEFDLGFPWSAFGTHPNQSFLLNMAVHTDYVDQVVPIHPSKSK